MKKFVFLSLSALLVLVAGCAGPTAPTEPPVIVAFDASPMAITTGGTTTLLWNVTGAESVTIDPGIGQVDVAGTMDLTPTQSTTYTLNAINVAGVVTKSASVTVSAPNPPSIVNFERDPCHDYLRANFDIAVGCHRSYVGKHRPGHRQGRYCRDQNGYS